MSKILYKRINKTKIGPKVPAGTAEKGGPSGRAVKPSGNQPRAAERPASFLAERLRFGYELT